MFKKYFSKRKLEKEKLLEFGFVYDKNKKEYEYTGKFSDINMNLFIFLREDEEIEVKTKVIDLETDEEYVLYKLENSSGDFVNKIRGKIKEALDEILEKCFDEVKNLSQKNEIINYMKEKYSDEMEYLWEKSPTSSIVRRKDNQKWYAVFMEVSKKKLGIEIDENIDVMNVRIENHKLEEIFQINGYFPAYHMNKKNWISIILDGSITTNEILIRLDKSYNLVANNSKKKK